MKLLKHLSAVLVFSAICLMGCQSSGLNISGTMAGAENLTVHFDNVGLASAVTSITSAKVNENGSFDLALEETPAAGIYRLRFGAKSVDIILNGDENNINVSGSLTDLDRFGYTLSGSPLSAEFQSKIQGVIKREQTAESLKSYIEAGANPLVSALIAKKSFQLAPQFSQLYQDIRGKIASEYNNEALAAEFEAEVNRIKNVNQKKFNVKLGDEAPDIVMPDVDGKTKKLSDLKGQIVLLDFWASWCGPCRKANPKVVEVYKKYQDQGFTVYSVSLDGLSEKDIRRYPDASQIESAQKNQKSRWLAAIEKDNLIWDNHVSELKKWDTPVLKDYGVTSIPTTFLIDREGKIASLNPKYNLEQELQKLL